MREKKFRMYSETHKKMYYPRKDEENLWVFDDEYNTISFTLDTKGDNVSSAFDKVIILDFIGLTDCDGEEIYEGNIVEDKSDQSRYIVEYDEEFARYILVWSSNEERFETFEALRSGNLKNIGNTYEHPHLSEGVK